MKIQDGLLVLLEYTLRDASGEVVDSSADDGPMEYVHGQGDLPEAIEANLFGQERGFEFTVTLPEGEAYGEYNPDGLISVPRDEFPADAEITKGEWIELTIEPSDDEGNPIENAEPEMMEAKIIEVSAEAVSLDANHPLAGQAVTFEMKVLSVEAADLEVEGEAN
ncbi:MAG: peptidylprolyl isomerase [Planctomycetota bacterium]|nr:peptidylprolyl isomerase [Planctomycetota bacterium]